MIRNKPRTKLGVPPALVGYVPGAPKCFLLNRAGALETRRSHTDVRDGIIYSNACRNNDTIAFIPTTNNAALEEVIAAVTPLLKVLPKPKLSWTLA